MIERVVSHSSYTRLSWCWLVLVLISHLHFLFGWFLLATGYQYTNIK